MRNRMSEKQLGSDANNCNKERWNKSFKITVHYASYLCSSLK